jgi:hypothetical protein
MTIVSILASSAEAPALCTLLYNIVLLYVCCSSMFIAGPVRSGQHMKHAAPTARGLDPLDVLGIHMCQGFNKHVSGDMLQVSDIDTQSSPGEQGGCRALACRPSAIRYYSLASITYRKT